MGHLLHISETARRLSVTPGYLRMLEKQGLIPQAQRDLNGRVYGEADIAMLRELGVGSRPTRLKSPREVAG
jgi:DNA-binding transcriptional MerR regulator